MNENFKKHPIHSLDLRELCSLRGERYGPQSIILWIEDWFLAREKCLAVVLLGMEENEVTFLKVGFPRLHQLLDVLQKRSV